MTSRTFSALAAALIIMLAASMLSPGRAANINTVAACGPHVPGDAPFFATGVGGAYSDATNDRFMTCSVPRSPVPGGANGAFYIDGLTANGFDLPCILYSINYTGQLIGSVSFLGHGTVPLGSYMSFDVFVTIPAAQLPTYAYTQLSCLMPGRTNVENAIILGATSLQ
jgi:hypothetical protein